MRSSLITLAVAAGVVAAAGNNDGDEVQMLFESWGTVPMVATPLEVAPGGATTWVVGCPADSEPTDCGFAVPIIATQGRSTMHYNRKLIDDYGRPELEYNQDNACVIGKGATCTWSYDGPYITHSGFLARTETDWPVVRTTTLTGDDLVAAMVPVQVVYDTTKIMSYGTDVYGQPTSYAATASRDDASFPGTATRTASSAATPDASVACETSSNVKTKATTDEPPQATGSSGPPTASSSPLNASSGISDNQAIALKVLAAVAFGGLIIVGAM